MADAMMISGVIAIIWGIAVTVFGIAMLMMAGRIRLEAIEIKKQTHAILAVLRQVHAGELPALNCSTCKKPLPYGEHVCACGATVKWVAHGGQAA